MKTSTILPVVLLVIIAILGSLLGYELTQRHRSSKAVDIEQARKQEFDRGFARALRGGQQVIIYLNVQAYHDAERGDVDGLKRRLVKLLAEETSNYTARYGTESSTNFVLTLADAKAIAGTLSQSNK